MASIATVTADAQPEPTIPGCPTPNAEAQWNANTTLPLTPYAKLCSCMMDTLRCIATKAKESDLATSPVFPSELLQTCESPENCYGVWANGTTGEYGAFSVCTRSERYSWAASGYLARNGEEQLRQSYLNFSTGIRELPKSNDEACPFLLAQVGSDGRGGADSYGDGGWRPDEYGDEYKYVEWFCKCRKRVIGQRRWGIEDYEDWHRCRVVVESRSALSQNEGIGLLEKPEKPELDSDDAKIDLKEIDGDLIVEAPRAIPEKPVKKDSPVELPAYEKSLEIDANTTRSSTDTLYTSPVFQTKEKEKAVADLIHPSLGIFHRQLFLNAHNPKYRHPYARRTTLKSTIAPPPNPKLAYVTQGMNIIRDMLSVAYPDVNFTDTEVQERTLNVKGKARAALRKASERHNSDGAQKSGYSELWILNQRSVCGLRK
ncbi:hypothetical protein BDV96DRAFT_694158 [Lophiotrema nucula]|uniref:X8 domain-containing protein n=1 Tax=Lophiotrema nucula TaxID=690887 RepID=A0A6A5YJJ2_9PLEO|nr:hypothetical protein BDV96DRAFT_694158 [Lophiotrema nucula]